MIPTIRVRLGGSPDRSYDIVFGLNLRRAIADIAARFPGSAKFVVTDANVNRFYGKYFRRRGRSRNGPFRMIVVPPGERSKTRDGKARLEDFLLSHHADRRSVIVALGGGVVGDLAGFAAATLFRGVPCVQIPTSLLAQVDSSVGGKVAVDHPLGKNLIGAFHQPERVYIDTGVLSTLPPEEFFNGMAEVIKMAAILDSSLFDTLENNSEGILKREPGILAATVKRCCELKRNIVEKDERESNLRRILNFGHTIGHSIEKLSNFRIAHGRAVSMGMVAEARLSVELGLLGASELQRLVLLLERYHLPVRMPRTLGAVEILSQTSMDKKVVDGEARYTLLERIGKARVGVRVSPSQARRALAQ